MSGRRSRSGGTPRGGGGKPRGGVKPRRDDGGAAPRDGGGAKPRGGGSAAPPARAEPAASPEAILYGLHPVQEALRARRREVKRVFAAEPHLHERWLEGVEVHAADADWIAARCGSGAHQGLCADVAPYPYASAESLLARESPLIVALDEVQDPQNLGSIVRTAECAGATGVVVPERRSADVTAAVAKASAGAVEHLPLARVRNLADFLGAAKGAGCWCYGAASGDGAVAWTQPDWTGGVVLVMGAEGKGLRPRVADACDALVELPLRGRIESLNVGAAAAALLYEIVRARA